MQIADIKEAIKPFLGDSTLEVCAAMNDAESMSLAQQISELAGLSGYEQAVWTWKGAPLRGIGVQVKSGDVLIPLADALTSHLQEAGLKVWIEPHPEWKPSQENIVRVNVYSSPIPNQ